MPATPDNGRPITERVRSELELIKENVAGVIGSLVATSDGFLIAHDLPEVEPTQLAALVATLHSVASRATATTGQGHFREAVTRGNDGYLAVYTVGDNAILAITGSSTLNVGMLQYHARGIVERIAEHSKGLAQWSAAPAPGRPAGGQRNRAGTLPSRRPAT